MKTILMIFLLICSLISCQSEKETDSISSTTTTSSPDFSKLKPDCFSPYSLNSIITTGDFNADLGFTKTTWNDPHVIKVGSEFWMYASSDDNFNHDIKIYRLTSSDGINWTLNPTTPILQKSAGLFDSEATETPAVVYFAGKYHMFWTGYSDHSDTKTFKIGHATSNDGINFTKEALHLVAPSDPSGAPNLDFDQFLVAESAPVVFNNKLYLYFTAVGANLSVSTTLQVIGVITSDDGTIWSAPVAALNPDQTLYPRAAPDYIKGYSTPFAIAMNNQVHLFFDIAQTDAAGTAFSQIKIHHASSSNGLTNWTHDSSEIFDKSIFSFTGTEIRSPSALLDGKNLMLWFAGHTDINDLGIGFATCGL